MIKLANGWLARPAVFPPLRLKRACAEHTGEGGKGANRQSLPLFGNPIPYVRSQSTSQAAESGWMLPRAGSRTSGYWEEGGKGGRNWIKSFTFHFFPQRIYHPPPFLFCRFLLPLQGYLDAGSLFFFSSSVFFCRLLFMSARPHECCK